MEHLEANVEAALSDPLPEAVMDETREAWLDLKGPVPQYNR